MEAGVNYSKFNPLLEVNGVHLCVGFRRIVVFVVLRRRVGVPGVPQELRRAT